MQITFQNGPLDPRNKPKRYIQIMTCEGVKDKNKPDQVDTTVEHGSYERIYMDGENATYEWKGKQ